MSSTSNFDPSQRSSVQSNIPSKSPPTAPDATFIEEGSDAEKSQMVAIEQGVLPHENASSGLVQSVSRDSFSKTSQVDQNPDIANKALNTIRNPPSRSVSFKFRSSGTKKSKKADTPKRVKKSDTSRVGAKASSKEPPPILIRNLNARVAKDALDQVKNQSQDWKSARTAVDQAKAKLDRLTTSTIKNPTEIKKAQSELQEAIRELENQPVKLLQTDSYGIETWEVTVQLNGQEHKAHVKEFPDGSYHGAKIDGFKVRQELLHNAAMGWLKKANSLNPEQKAKAKEHLNLLNQQFEKDLKAELESKRGQDFKKLSESQKFDKSYKKDYGAIHKDFLEKIAQYAKDIEHIINHSAGKKVINQGMIAKAECAYVRERGRPIIINTFKYKSETFVGIQTPARRVLEGKKRVNAKTIPSTIRDGAGLANYVTSSFGVVGKGGEITILSEATRHSSYSAKSLEDQEMRQLYGCQNVESCLTDLAEKQLIALQAAGTPPPKTDPTHPLEVPLRTFLLLTTGIGDTAIRNKSGKEFVGDAEGTQLRDSAFALTAYKGAVFQVDLGKQFGKVWIKADIKFMNMGTNLGVTDKGIGKITFMKKSEKMINAIGFVEIDDEFTKGIEKIEADLKVLIEGEGDKAVPKTVASGVNFLLKFSEDMLKLQKNTDLEEKIEKLSKAVRAPNAALRLQGPRLRELQGSISNQGQVALDSKTRSKLKRHYKTSKKIQDTIGSLHEPIVIAMRKLWKANRGQLLEAQGKFNHAMDNLLEDIKGKHPELEANLKKYRDVVNNVIQARDIYHMEAYNKTGHLNEFQSVCIETEQLLGNNVEFFCKSAEDRTGRMDDRVMERQVFKHMNGYSPRSEEDYKKMNTEVTDVVHQFSTSQDNTEQNSGARGEQVEGKANPEQAILYDVGRSHSLLAKNVFTESKKLTTPSEYAETLTKT